MRIISKLIILFISITFLRLLPGCCSCDDEYFSFNYENVLIRNIDNSGQWSMPSNINIMPATGVAFEIQIAGSEPLLTANRSLKFYGFSSLSAQSCNCDEIYIANQTITDIRIRTLQDLNDDFCCNDDVTSLFLANSCIACEDIGNFYISIDELVRRINPESFYHTPVNKFLIYLSVPVENVEAAFEIEVVLNNGQSMVTQTSLITII